MIDIEIDKLTNCLVDILQTNKSIHMLKLQGSQLRTLNTGVLIRIKLLKKVLI